MKVADYPSTRTATRYSSTMRRIDRREKPIRKKRHSCFEWIQLIATICIPIIIAMYTFIDNNKKESIAVADRRKDMDIANNSRIAELDIAEQSRQKDRDLALDQQRENILVQYQTFMATLLMENGLILNETQSARAVAVSMILTTLSQLDSRRRSVLMRSLYHSKLITLRKDSKILDTSVLQLGILDLSDITFGSPRDSPATRPRQLYIDWYYLWLPHATLTNTSFRHALLDCATLSMANMDGADLSFITPADPVCFGTVRIGQTDFSSTSLVNASLYKAQFRFASFTVANLTFADMREFYCAGCLFWSATLFQVDLSFSRIFQAGDVDPGRLNFDSTNLRQADMHSAYFAWVSFFQSDWSSVQASQISLVNCTFINAKMEYCSLKKSYIGFSIFQNTSLFGVDLGDATLYNVSFVNSDMRNANMTYIQCNYCDFTNVTLQGAVLKNASLRYTIFRGCDVEASQFKEVIDLSGSILPNGTRTK